MLIGGQLQVAPATFPVINPATGAVFAHAPECSQKQLDEAVRAAKMAFPKWAALEPKKRSEYMLGGAEKVQANLDELAKLLTQEQGKPLAHAKGEIMGIAMYLKHFANQKLEFEKVIKDTKKERVIQRRAPLGVVGGITPWNFPPLMGAWKMAEALVTGNTMVLKPSPYTPLSTLLLGEVLADSFPAGVFNVVSGNNDVGKWITEHPDVAKISFTGSTRTGKAIQAATSGTLKRLTLELGGNDAAVVLPGSNVKKLAPQLFGGAMRNTGQVCVAIKRLYVHESQYEEMVTELAACAKAAKVGDGMDEGTQYGPINNKMQFDRVSELVEDARKAGATIAAGGSAPATGGYFYSPTIVSHVKEGVRIVDEEQFGPVLPVLSYSTVDEAVERANTSEYGLGASVWGGDPATAEEVAQRLYAGTVWVNTHGDLSPDVPFGGVKESGVGRQMGEATLEGYTEVNVVRIKKAAL